MVAGAIKHVFVSAKADGGDATLVKPSNWNEDHEGGISVLDRDLAEVDINNTTAESSIYSFSVPANILGTTGGLRLTLTGDYMSSVAAGRTLIVRIKLGVTTIFTSNAAAFGLEANNRKWWLELLVMLSAADAEKASVRMSIGAAAAPNFGISKTGDAAPSETFIGNGQNNSIAEDMTSAKTLNVTVQHSVAEANLRIRKEMATLELLSPA